MKDSLFHILFNILFKKLVKCSAGKSLIHGVGMIANRRIKKDEPIFCNWHAFGIVEWLDGFYGFNHACIPSVICKDGVLISNQDIDIGEELTLYYSPPLRFKCMCVKCKNNESK